MSKTSMIVPSAPKAGAFSSHAKWSPIKSAVDHHKIASPAGAGVSPFATSGKADKYGAQPEAGSNWGPFKSREQFNSMHFC